MPDQQYILAYLRGRSGLVSRRNLSQLSWSVVLIIAVILARYYSVEGQVLPKAILVDEFGSVACADLIAREDSFLGDLSSNPSDIGYAIVYSNEKAAESYVQRLRANLLMREFDRNRIRIVLAKPREELPVSGSFWRVPPGAEPPSFESIGMKAPDATVPFIFGTNYSEGDCPSFSADLFAELILNHPGSRARLVVYGPTSAWRQSTADEALDEMKRFSKLPKDRIEIYFVHRPNLSYTWTEFWYLPARTQGQARLR